MALPTRPAATKTAAPSEYTTTRLDVAALLLYHNAPMTDAALDDRHVRFVFNDENGDASNLAHQHDLGAVTVASRRYAAAMDQARDLVFQVRRAAGLAR